MNEKFLAVMSSAQERLLFPGASFVWMDGVHMESGAVGCHTYEADAPAVTPETIYDVASLTKVIGPMSVAAQLIDEGVISLNTAVADVLPEFASEPEKQQVTVHHLMTYTVDFQYDDSVRARLWRTKSGGPLPAAEFQRELLRLPLQARPGSTYQYSDITMITLTELVARVTGTNLPRLVRDRFFVPLGMRTATFDPLSLSPRMTPPTEITPERGEVCCRIHDEKADHLYQGGLTAGSAGLFASTEDIAQYLRLVLGRGVWAGERFWSEELFARFYTDQFPAVSAHTPLMWGDRFGQPGYSLLSREYTPSLYGEYPGTLLTKGGFTGCFVAVDCTRERALAFLSNHTYPKRCQDHANISQLKESLLKLLAG